VTQTLLISTLSLLNISLDWDKGEQIIHSTLQHWLTAEG
jgi:hypothetical protein